MADDKLLLKLRLNFLILSLIFKNCGVILDSFPFSPFLYNHSKSEALSGEFLKCHFLVQIPFVMILKFDKHMSDYFERNSASLILQK